MDNHNISQAELSRLTGIHVSLVNKLVHDQRRWNTDQIHSVCRALNISPQDIFAEQLELNDRNAEYRIDSVIDSDILAEAILQTENFLKNHKINISPQRKAKLVLKLYEHWLVEQESPDDSLTRRYFHLV